MSVANVLLRLEEAGCDIWATAFNGNTLDVTVVAYDPDWHDKFCSRRGGKPTQQSGA